MSYGGCRSWRAMRSAVASKPSPRRTLTTMIFACAHERATVVHSLRRALLAAFCALLSRRKLAKARIHNLTPACSSREQTGTKSFRADPPGRNTRTPAASPSVRLPAARNKKWEFADFVFGVVACWAACADHRYRKLFTPRPREHHANGPTGPCFVSFGFVVCLSSPQ